MCRPSKNVRFAVPFWLNASRCRRSLPKPAHPAAPAPIFRLTSWRRSSQLSMCDVNESQPGDAGNQQPPRTQDEAASASNGVGRTHQVLCTITDAPSVVDSLASDHSGVQHLTTLLGQSASDLDLQVMKLKAERAEMKREKTRLSAQPRNTERKQETPLQPRHQTQQQRPPRGLRHARARPAGEEPPEHASGGLTVGSADLRASYFTVHTPDP